MRITNKLGLPDALVRAVANDGYSKGDADFSVTELLKPPRQRALQAIHADEITEDVSERIWSLLGQTVHLILERANVHDLAEKRFFVDVNGYRISGQIDSLCLENGTLTDFKTTTVWKFMANKPIPPEYEQQLNMQNYLLFKNGHVAKKLQIIGILRDWSQAQQKRSRDYPNTNVAKMEIPMWTHEKTLDFIETRIALHRGAEKSLPFCMDEETWQGRRCKDYCSASKFCSQYTGGNNE